MENKIVPINKEVVQEENSELKDLMMGNMIQGLLGNGLEDKLPGLLEAFAPKAYDGIRGMLEEDRFTYMIYFDKQYGIVLHKVDNNHAETNLKFPEPAASDLIIIQKQENGLSVIKDAQSKSLKDLLKSVMTSIGGKLF